MLLEEVFAMTSKVIKLLLLTPQKDILFIIGDWYAKVGSQEIPGVIGKCGLKSTE